LGKKEAAADKEGNKGFAWAIEETRDRGLRKRPGGAWFAFSELRKDGKLDKDRLEAGRTGQKGKEFTRSHRKETHKIERQASNGGRAMLQYRGLRTEEGEAEHKSKGIGGYR